MKAILRHFFSFNAIILLLLIVTSLIGPRQALAAEGQTDWIFGNQINHGIGYDDPLRVLLRDGQVAHTNTGSGLLTVHHFNPVSLPNDATINKVELRFHMAGSRVVYRFQQYDPIFINCTDYYNPGYYKWFDPASMTELGDYIGTYTALDCNINEDKVRTGDYYAEMVWYTGPIDYTIDDISVRFFYTYPEVTPTPTPTPKLVPLLKQTDTAWSSQAYDHVPSGCETIEKCGCLTTSIAMVMQYYGVTKLPDGTLLNPGTLNTWLKNNKGYLRDGSVIQGVAATVASKAKAQNPEFIYDGIEYLRDRSANKVQTLTTDIQNEHPGILEEPGHFIVATGISANTFTINDPARNISTLAQSPYNNSFLSLSRYIPSYTDLSYITLAVDPNVDIVLKNENGVILSEGYTSYKIQNPIDLYPINIPSLKVLEFQKPSTGIYSIEITSSDAQQYQLDSYLISEDGDTVERNLQGYVIPGVTSTIVVSYNKDTNDSTSITPDISLQQIKTQLQLLYEQGEIDTYGVYVSLKPKIDYAIQNSSSGAEMTADAIRVFLSELNAQRGKHVSEDAYQLLQFEVNYLLNQL